MEGISTIYIISQVFVIIQYTLLSLTYQASSRKKVLIMNFGAITFEAMAYILLHAYTGLAMCFVAFIRNTIFLIDEKKNGKTEIMSKKDIAILLILFSITIISTIFTYDGILSLLAVVATMVQVPAPTPVTTPSLLNVATLVFVLIQVNF